MPMPTPNTNSALPSPRPMCLIPLFKRNLPSPPLPLTSTPLWNLGCCGFFALMFFGIPALGVINGQRRKLKYLPPKISIEGHGIKRGLTAVEAAILMEQPLDKVMTMILFGVVKKEAAEVETRDPLKLKIASPLPEGLHEYEKNFLQAFRPDANAKQRRTDLQDMTIKSGQSGFREDEGLQP